MQITKKCTSQEYAQFAHECNVQGLTIMENGTFYEGVKPVVEPLTVEQIRVIREELYKIHVDPLTAHINRLRDMEPDSKELTVVIAKRTELVAKIRAENPYPEIAGGDECGETY